MAFISKSFSSQVRLFDPIPHKKSRTLTTTCAIRRDGNSSGKLVDENLIVLRKRIHEMKMMERNYEPPAEWMDWEKRIYASYDSIICDAMAQLQSQLLETRPSLAFGMFALIWLSVPFSTGFVMFNLLEISKVVLSGIHLS